MSLLEEIRTDLTNQSADLSNTLRKAKVLASAIGLPEFRDWVDSELNGYKDSDKLPDYRVHPTQSLGSFAGSFGSGYNNVILPTHGLPDLARDFCGNVRFFDGVGALEAQKGNDGQIRWSQEMLSLAREHVKMSNGMVLVDAHMPVPAYVVMGVLDQIKTRLLDFVLALEENHVTEEDLNNRAVAPEMAQSIFNTYIYGNQNTVATGEQVTQHITTVQQGNVDSLLDHLLGLDIGDDDLGELQAVIEDEPAASGGEYGPKAKAWLGGMVAKAATGTWKVGVEAGTKMLTNALNQYYGF